MGRVVNSIGQPIDGKGPLKCPLTGKEAMSFQPVRLNQGSVLFVASPCTSRSNWYRAIDSMIPIGRGQRELIRTVRLGKLPSASTPSSIKKKSMISKNALHHVAIGQK